MSLLPEHIQERIIIDAIILKKNETGWKDIHLEITSFTVLNKTNYVFDYYVHFEHAYRLKFTPSIYWRWFV